MLPWHVNIKSRATTNKMLQTGRDMSQPLVETGQNCSIWQHLINIPTIKQNKTKLTNIQHFVLLMGGRGWGGAYGYKQGFSFGFLENNKRGTEYLV